jgi:hypothetical protein
MNPTTSEAILKLHPTAKFATSGDKVVHWGESYKQPTESEIAAAKETLKTEYTNNKYKRDRVTDGSKTYDALSNQLDMLYHDLVAGKLDATGTWAKHIKAVKDANPKP